MNLANKLTISRILLVPVFILALVMKIKYQNISVGNYIAAVIFIIAASTDGIDGYIARKRKQVTNFGKFLDPLADKLLVTAALIWLVEKGEISSWVATIIIGREFIVTGLRLIAVGEGIVISASLWGKVKTIAQIIAIIITLIHDLAPFENIFNSLKVFGFIQFHQLVMGVAVLITIYSGIDYLYQNRNVIASGIYEPQDKE